MVLFSLIIAGFHDKYDLLNLEIIEICYTTFFVVGFILFCLSKPISNLIQSPTLKTYLIKSGEIIVCFSVLLASFGFIYWGIIFYDHRTFFAINLYIIGVLGIIGSITKVIFIFKTKNCRPYKEEKGNFKLDNEKSEIAIGTNGPVKFKMLNEEINKDIKSIKDMFSELPRRYQRQGDIVGPGAGKGSELIKIICSVCDDVIKALRDGVGVEGIPIDNAQIANGLKRLISDARQDTGVIAMQLNSEGVHLYNEYLSKLERIADIIRMK